MLEIRFANESDLAVVFSNVFDCWPHANSLHEHISKRLQSPQHRYAKWLVGSVENKIVSSLGVYPFEYLINSKNLKACGIGAVHTVAEYRARGYARKMFTYLHEYMKAQDIKLSFLFSDIGVDYYSALGYKELKLDHYNHERKKEKSSTHFRLSESFDWSQYREFYDRKDLYKSTIHRSLKHWRWLEARWPQPCACSFYEESLEAMFLLEISKKISNKASVLDACWPAHWNQEQITDALEEICLRYNLENIKIWLPRTKLKREGFAASKEIAMVYELEPLAKPLEELQLFPIDHI